ncbi:class I SAM-dependent methyltransferase [Streptomyces sp. HSW2009]|uniref:class I SAM-dependent methyltransferase n=1 Tax=Streptomyces sp. HSW2009 TaxID=3142890 RepID=UPI0032EE0900
MAERHAHSQTPEQHADRPPHAGPDHGNDTGHGRVPTHTHSHTHSHTHGHRADLDWAREGVRLVAEAELYGPVAEQMVGALRERFGAVGRHPDEVRRVLDVGSGPGVFTCLLAEAFPRAEVVAVDAAQPLLDLVAERAAGLGLGDRVGTLRAELPHGVTGPAGVAVNGPRTPGDDAYGPAGSGTPEIAAGPVVAGIGEADLIWSRKALHHVGDQREVVQRLARSLRPGGLLALSEGGLPIRFLPRDFGLGRPGLQSRLTAATEEWFNGMRAGLPGSVPMVEDWAGLLDSVGLKGAASRSFLLDLPAPLAAAGRAHLTATLTRLRERAPELLDTADQQVLDQLIDPADPAGVARRQDVFLLTAETLHTAYA